MTGEELRDQGMERAGSGLPVGPFVSWQSRAWLAVLHLCNADAAFCAEDVRRAAGDPPHPNALGAVMRQAYRQGLIVPDSVGVATRPERHASLLRYWRRKL